MPIKKCKRESIGCWILDLFDSGWTVVEQVLELSAPGLFVDGGHVTCNKCHTSISGAALARALSTTSNQADLILRRLRFVALTLPPQMMSSTRNVDTLTTTVPTTNKRNALSSQDERQDCQARWHPEPDIHLHKSPRNARR